MAARNAPERAAFPTNPEEFDEDERISYSKTAETYVLEDETGSEWEWTSNINKWVPVTDEALVEQQREIYKMQGVDEDAPAVDLKKRKAAEREDGNVEKASKKQKPEQGPKQNKAVYVTSLPGDADVEEINEVFSKYGVIAESLDSNEPRIKMYYDDNGNFKGEALIVYFRAESVGLAIQLLDDTNFRYGKTLPTGPMRVVAADTSFKSQQDRPLASEQAKKKGTTANKDRQKAIKKTEEMNSRLADWDDDDPQAIPDTSSRFDKVVMIHHMFARDELQTDPTAAADIKDDILEDGGIHGEVKNVTIFDKEEDPVVSVRFANAMSARAYARKVDGRGYDGRTLEAYIADGTEKFKKTRKQDLDEEEEEARLAKFQADTAGD